MLRDARIVLIEKYDGTFSTFIKKKDSLRILELIDIMFESKIRNGEKLEITLPKEWMIQSIKKVLNEQGYKISDEICGVYFIEFTGK